MLAAAILIAVAAAGNVVVLHFRSDRQREAELLLDRVEELAIAMQSEQQAVAARPDSAAEAARHLSALRSRMDVALGRLVGLAPRGVPDAAVLLQTPVVPGYEQFMSKVAETRLNYGLDASQTNSWAMIGSVAVLALSVFFIGALFLTLERTNRNAEVLSTERLAVRQSTERFRALIQNASDVFCIAGGDGAVYYASPAALRVTGHADADLIGRNFLELVHEGDQEQVLKFFAQVLDSYNENFTTELRFQQATGEYRTAEIVANNLGDDPALGGILITYRDIGDRKVMEEKLRHLAYHDPLTDLPNRSLFMEELESALTAKTGLRAGWPVTVLFLDMDNFKIINDSLGHQYGDRLLLAASDRIKACLAFRDIAGHLGGDEFVLLLRDVGDTGDAIRQAERIRDLFRKPFDLGGHEVFASVSMGIAMSGPGYDEPESLLRAADLAMYTAKTRGKARFEVFDKSMEERVKERLAMETDLRRALERGEFRVFYQPIVSFQKKGRVAEVEALVRWQHPQRGLVSPVDFIPIAEETGMIVPLGKWVLNTACRQVREWQLQHPDAPPLMVSVNLSGKQLQDPSIAHEVARALHESGLDPACLKLEITESVMMHDAELTSSTMKRLKLLGIKLAIDDFGTGYSSLGYLKRFPVDVLKIDRSFVDRLGRDPEEKTIVNAIIIMAKALGLTVTGEGIETVDQMSHLQALGCDNGQGFLFAKPLAAMDAEELLRSCPTFEAITEAMTSDAVTSDAATSDVM
ncbi:MAG TPA: EAL domain-containing protein [Symbiobacteriaceae bacterium]